MPNGHREWMLVAAVDDAPNEVRRRVAEEERREHLYLKVRVPLPRFGKIGAQ